MKRSITQIVSTSALASFLAVGLNPDPAPAQVSDCPQTSPPTTYDDTTLDTLTEFNNGVVYHEVAGNGRLRLANQGGFVPVGPPMGTPLGVTDFVAAAEADFNGDGRIDFVAGRSDGTTTVYLNFSNDASALWSDPTYYMPPDFQPSATSLPPNATNPRMRLAASDFNGDGNPDILRLNINGAGVPQDAQMFLYTGNAGTDPLFAAPYVAISNTEFSGIGSMPGNGNNVAVTNVNFDGSLDLLIGATSGGGGAIHKFQNDCTLVSPLPIGLPPWPCTNNPTFSHNGDLVTNMGMGASSLPVFVFTELTGDGYDDLVAGASACCATASLRLRLWRGQGIGIVNTLSPPQSLTFPGGVAFIVAADFIRNGRRDLMVGIDGDSPLVVPGGRSLRYANNRTSTPFTDPPTQITDTGSPMSDFDVALAFNYDNDPDGTDDLIIVDNTGIATDYRLLSTRPGSDHVPKGDVVSGIVDLGALSTVEMAIIGARLSITQTIPSPPNDKIEWYLSNNDVMETPVSPPAPQWNLAVDCGDASGDLCVTFANQAKRQLRWKAVITRDPGTPSSSPYIQQVVFKFDYNEAAIHSMAGVVVHDGVAYVGGFGLPGDRGKFYAYSADLTTLYWEAGAKIDAMDDDDRNIYTWDEFSPGAVEFKYSGIGSLTPQLQFIMGGDNSEWVDWIRGLPDPRGDGPRFGLKGQPTPQTHFGAVETSTPAIVGRPGLPIWYVFADSTQREQVDTFISAHSSRPTLVLIGAKDGMLHALRNDPTNIGNVNNGNEMWAYIPRRVAGRIFLDWIFSHLTLDTELSVSAYVDGSPSVADVRIGGNLRTVTVFGMGNGGPSVAALDITDTVSAGYASVTPPAPLWEKEPGGFFFVGNSFSKPAIIRVNGETSGELFLAVAATGIALSETPPYTKGKIVEAYNVGNGSLVWKFETMCPVTTDIVAFETDDTGTGEPGAPTIDGYIDRVVFGDACGYVYKLDPGKEPATAGKWNVNDVMGTIDTVNTADGQTRALFATNCGLTGNLCPLPGDVEPNGDRPISGITVRVDTTGRAALFFGTGGLSYLAVNPADHNAFFKVYADSGEVRAKITGACNVGPRMCEKFYASAATTEQIIVSRSIDPEVATGSCDKGSSTIQSFQFDDDGSLNLVTSGIDFTQSYNAATTSPLYAHGGAVYFVQEAGVLQRIGAPRAATAGGDTATGGGGGLGPGDGGGSLGSNKPMVLLGWRQIF